MTNYTKIVYTKIVEHATRAKVRFETSNAVWDATSDVFRTVVSYDVGDTVNFTRNIVLSAIRLGMDSCLDE